MKPVESFSERFGNYVAVVAVILLCSSLFFSWFEWQRADYVEPSKIVTFTTSVINLIPDGLAGTRDFRQAVRADGLIVLSLAWFTRLAILSAFLINLAMLQRSQKTGLIWVIIIAFLVVLLCTLSVEILVYPDGISLGQRDNPYNWRLTRVDWQGPVLFSIGLILQVAIIVRHVRTRRLHAKHILHSS